MTVTALTALDDVMIAVPMALSQPFRDNDVLERFELAVEQTLRHEVLMTCGDAAAISPSSPFR